jgi:hypothetical protein
MILENLGESMHLKGKKKNILFFFFFYKFICYLLEERRRKEQSFFFMLFFNLHVEGMLCCVHLALKMCQHQLLLEEGGHERRTMKGATLL